MWDLKTLEKLNVEREKYLKEQQKKEETKEKRND